MSSCKYTIFICARMCVLAIAALNSGLSLASEKGVEWQQGVIEGALMYNSNLQITDLEVVIKGSFVELYGACPTQLSKSLAEQITLNIAGVEAVLNQIKIVPGKFSRTDLVTINKEHHLSNITISNKVKSQLLANPLTTGLQVNVHTNNRQVLLTGQVKSSTEKDLAYWLVKNTSGVTNVTDELEILRPTETLSSGHF